MNTTAAAAEAHVTVTTIRAWCRNGVVTATKAAGRWVINAASLAHRIAIAAMRTTRKANDMDLNATYTYTRVGDTEPQTITPRIKTRVRNGLTLTSIDRLAPLLADQIDAIDDESGRAHTLTVLEGSGRIVLSDQPRGEFTNGTSRDDGRIVTTYQGTRWLPVSAVLDLAEQIRAALA